MNDHIFALNLVYEFIRGSVGFSLIVAGISVIIAPDRKKIHLHIACFFASAGFLFCLSALDPVLKIPLESGNILIFSAMYILSQCLFEIVLYLFGNERKPGSRRFLHLVGFIWFALLFAIPLLDYALGWESVYPSVEDGFPLGPLHSAASSLMYIWPLLILILGIKLSKYSINDIPERALGSRFFIAGIIVISFLLAAIMFGAVLDSVILYRVGHTILEFFVLFWYFLYIARPDFFSRARKEIQKTHEKNVMMDEAETEIIAARISEILRKPDILCHPDLDLRKLAFIIKVPPYRLSQYFNIVLHITFSNWLNVHRIESVRQKICQEPSRSVLEIAMETGYNSKSVFNSQFLKITGMTPTEFRRSMLPK